MTPLQVAGNPTMRGVSEEGRHRHLSLALSSLDAGRTR